MYLDIVVDMAILVGISDGLVLVVHPLSINDVLVFVPSFLFRVADCLKKSNELLRHSNEDKTLISFWILKLIF